MRLERDTIIELRKGGNLGGKEVFGLLRQPVADVPDIEAEPEEPTVAPILERLAAAVEKLEQPAPVPESLPPVVFSDLAPLLTEIRGQLQELNAAARKAEASRLKSWEFVPEYGHTGRIIKITVK
jgi:hypothetical protein